MDSLKEIGERIRSIRLKLGLKQAQFAAKVGARKGSISGYEKGDHEAKLVTLIRIAELGDVPITWLLMGKDSCAVYIQKVATDEEEILSNYRKLTKADKRFVSRIVKMLSK